jgi:phosphoglycolate phosphatase
MDGSLVNLNDYELILWDLDGTLVDSRLDLVEATNVAMRTLGYPLVPFDRFSRMVGQGVRHLVTQALPPDVPPERIETAIGIFLDWYKVHLADNTRFYDGMKEGISRLSVPSAVVSNKREELCRSILERLGAETIFVAVVGGDTCPERKPDPMPVLHVVKSRGATPGRTLMVGDSAVDIEAGNRAGVRTCGVMWGFGDPSGHPLFKPDFLVAGPEEFFPRGV